MTDLLTNPVAVETPAAPESVDTRRVSVGGDTILVAVAALGAAVIGAWAGTRHGSTMSLGVVAVAGWVAIAIGMSTVVRRTRLARISGAVAGLHAIAGGDLTRPDRTGARLDDEAAAIDAAGDRLAARLRTEIADLEIAARRLKVGWNEVYRLGISMLEMSEGTVHDATQAATSAEQVSQNMQHIAAATVEMATTVRDIAGHAASASSIANAGAQQVLQASGTMSELEEASQQVQDVVELISSIASQTRVLALNATIEAGRAGDAGRGFVVVADSVKGLAKKTADATDQVTATVRGIKSGSNSAVDVMRQITEMIRQVSDNQTAIASSVEEQTATTSEVGQSSAVVADSAVELARSVQSLTHALRVTAYVGAHAKTVAAHLTELEESISGIAGLYTFERPEEIEAEVSHVYRSSGITKNGNTTAVQDFVAGDGINQFNYQGRWEHGAGNVEADGSDSYCSIPGDTITFRFVGTRFRFYGVGAQNHGMAEVSVDDGPVTMIDEYAPHRMPATMYYESPVLPRGEHTFKLVVNGQTNPLSKYYWVTCDFAEIDD
ncbi:MAG: methyl-accepting chemotaxis sensory transducer [Frankiales bacterium]|nr:methyl-accepting chemotaxis sensory transducer [Frankiales bacterium]